MMGNSRTNEKGKAPVSADSPSSRGISPPSGLTFLEGNLDEDAFDSLLDMSSTFADLEALHRPVAQVNPETVPNPQLNMSSNTVNTNLQGVSLSPDWNMNWGQQSAFHARNNASFNQSRSGIQGNFADGFLDLRLGGNDESVSRSQVGSRETSDKLKETTSNELKKAWLWEGMAKTRDDGFMGFRSNNSGLSNQFCYQNQMTSTNNEVGFHGSLNSWPGSSMQQNDMRPDKIVRPRELDHLRDERLKEAVSTELKMLHARQAMRQSLNDGLVDFQCNNSGLSNRGSNVDGMTLTNNEVVVHGSLNSGLGTSLNHTSQMQQNDSRLRSGDLNRYRAFIGNRPVHSGTIGGNSAQDFNSRQLNLNKPSESEKSLHLASYMCSTTANNPNYAGQVISQSSTPSQVPGVGCNMYPQRTAVPQVLWVESGLAGIDEPYPKRLGVEFNARNSLQSNQTHLSPMGASFQTSSRGQVCQYPDKGLTRPTDHVLRPSVDRTDGAPVGYPIKSLEPVFAHGQSQNVPIQLAKDPQEAPSTNASDVTSQSEKTDLRIRPHHKRSAVVPHPASRWAQRRKLIHPTVHNSMPKPFIPVTTAQVHPYQTVQAHLSIPAVSQTPIVPHSIPKPYVPLTNPYQTAQALPSIPAKSRTQPADPVAARIRPAIPCASTIKPRVPVANSLAVAHITSKGSEATRKLSGYKCFLCKRDLALTSEGPVYQPAAPPPVAILPCGHTFHDQCLQNITPDDQAKDPPCIPCAIGEQ